MASESRVPVGDRAWLRYFRKNFAKLTDGVAYGPTAYTQTFSTADRTHAARTATSAVTSPAVNLSQYGFAAASQADAVITKLNAVIVDLADTAQVVNALVDDFQSYGLLS